MRGWIEKRVGKKGTSYRIRWEQGTSAPSQTFKTKTEAKAELNKILGADTLPSLDKRTLQEYLDDWLKNGLKRVRPTTARRYQDIVRLHITPALGSTRLSQLTAIQVDRFYTAKLSTHSGGTVAIIHQVLHKALRQAVRWGVINRNPTDQVEAPKPQRTEFKIWTQEQTKRFLKESKKSDLAALFQLAIFSGLRRGELLGLRWEDLDLERGSLSIRRTYSRDETGNWQIGNPKTRASSRFIPLSAASLALLRDHRERQRQLQTELGTDYQDQGMVFTNGFGLPLHVNSLMGRYQKLVEKAQVPLIRFHDLRHTSATMSLANGTHPKIVQERLGHSSISMTMDLYSHTTMQLGQEEADRLEKLLEDEEDVRGNDE